MADAPAALTSGDSGRPPQRQPASGRKRTVIAALVLIFVVVSWAAASQKSATVDEPYHLGSAIYVARHNDFRVDPEDPPLWKYWVMLPHVGRVIQTGRWLDSPDWAGLIGNVRDGWRVSVYTVYRSGNDWAALFTGSRAMMLVVGAALAVMVSVFTWRIAGAAAAVIATFLFCFDPNFLGHAPLVKNDVAASLCLLWIAYAGWRVGQKITWPRVLMLGIACGVSVATKFSGVVFVLVVPILLAMRAISPVPWPLGGVRELLRPAHRIGFAALVLVVVVGIAYVILWAAYGFRYDPTPTPGVELDTRRCVATIAMNQLTLRNGGVDVPPDRIPSGYFETYVPPASVRALLWCEEKHLVPQAWVTGFLYTYASAQVRQSYLLGEVGQTGWWYYFPLAMLFKTPIVTMLVVVIGGIGFVRAARSSTHGLDRWTVLAVVAPLVVYGVSALSTRLNIGVRHVMPLYPLLYVMAGVGIAAMSPWRWKWGRLAVAAAAAGLSVETLSAFPDYIAYFNAAAGGSRGGYRLLGDSNLDWGQDLPALVKWQKNHPDEKLYLVYFGQADADAYGLQYTNLPGGHLLAPDPQMPREPGVVAISATVLQAIYSRPDSDVRTLYAPFRSIKPFEVLGGTIYLYRFPDDLRRSGATAASGSP